jgi:hypothetical protein
MIFRQNLLLVFLLFSAFAAVGQTATLRGIVRDESGKPVFAIVVRQKDNPQNGTTTDENGKFSITIPSDLNVTLLFKGVGSDESLQTFTLKSGEIRDIDVTYESGLTLDSFVIEDKRRREDGIKRIETKLNTELPVINGGIEKFLIQAPVNFSSELSSSYSVRGGSFDENMVYVNDIQVYRPFLVRAGQQEGLSFPNPDMVSSIDFSGGGFQAKFGDKMSSVLDIQYARPDSFNGAFQIGMLGTQLQLAGISKNRKWTNNSGYRYKDYSYILNSLDVQAEYKPRFHDFQTYTTFRPEGEYGSWELSFLGNISSNRYNFIPQNRETDVGSINEALRFTVFYEGQEITRFTTYFGAFAARYNPSETSQLKFIASTFLTNESEHFDVLGAYRLDELERDQGSDRFGQVLRNRGVGGFLQHGRNDLTARVHTFSHRGFKEFDVSEHLVQWGAEVVLEDIRDELNEWQLLDSAGYAAPRRPDTPGASTNSVNTIAMRNRVKAVNDVRSERLSAFVQDTWRKDWDNGNTFSATAGVRANHWTYNKQTVVSPRMNFSFTPQWLATRRDRETNKVDTVRKDIVLTAAFGYYYQPPFYREMRGFDGKVNPNIRAQQSIHYILGANYVFQAWDRPFKLVTELYYKSMKQLIPYELENVRQRYFAKNDADGFATGADVMLNGEFIPGVQSWLRASILKTSENLFDDFYRLYLNSDGDTIYQGFTLNDTPVDSITVRPGYIPRPTDQRFSFSMLFQDQMPKRPEYKVLVNLYFATGMPYGQPDQQRYNDVLRTRSYFRTDVGFSRDMFYNKKKNNFFTRNIDRGTLSLEVFNLLGISNIINHQWIQESSGRQYGIPTYLTGRRINLRFSIHF